MSVKEISEAIESGNILFGVKQALKYGSTHSSVSSKKGAKASSSSGKLKNVFIAKDTRDETVEKLEIAKIEFIVLKSKADLAKELNLDFECEVFCLK